MTLYRSGPEIVGAAIMSLRKAIGWTQVELGMRVGMSQSQVSRIERGQLTDLSFGTAERLLSAMGARLVTSVDAPFLGDRQRQREPAHARCSAHVVSRLRRAGWQVATEVEVGGDRSRGWIDVLACHPETGLMLIIEIKTEIRDFGAIERALGWYEREAWSAARRLGWRPRHSMGCLLLLATEANDVRFTENRETFAVGFPLRARHLAACLGGDAGAAGHGRAVAMIDPLSRRAGWLRPMRADGRRSVAPFADYADFMRATGTRPGRRRTAPTRPRRRPYAA
jgi:transcriptional regulator with XRE-family HTH domain